MYAFAKVRKTLTRKREYITGKVVCVLSDYEFFEQCLKGLGAKEVILADKPCDVADLVVGKLEEEEKYIPQNTDYIFFSKEGFISQQFYF